MLRPTEDPERSGSADRSAPRQPEGGRLLGWGTFWGRHLGGLPFSPSLAALVVGGSVVLMLSALLGVEEPSAAWSAGSLPPILLRWTCAVIAFLLAVFAWGRIRAGHFPEAVVLGVVMPVVAVLDGAVALVGVYGLESWTELLWMGSRTWMACGFLMAGWFVWRANKKREMTGLQAVSLPLGLGLGVGLMLLAVSALRPDAWAGSLSWLWHLLPLALFLASGLYILPALHRNHTSIISYALIISSLPQVLCQAEAILLPSYASPLMVADQQKLLAYLTLLAGTVLDYIASHRATARALAQIQHARSELYEQSQQLRRVDFELAERRIEKEWVESRLRMLEKAVETMSLGVTITRPDGRIVYTNPADARMHGFTVSDLIGRHAKIFQPLNVTPIPPPSGEDFQLWVRETLNRSQDGRVFPVRLISDAVSDEQGRLLALVTICEDISERKRTERALERRDRVLRAVSLAAERFLVEEDWEGSVREVLGRLGLATGVTHVYLGRWAEEGDALFGSLWSAGQGRPEDSTLAWLKREEELVAVLRKYCDDPGALHGPAGAMPAPVAAAMAATGTYSMALVAVMIADRCWGMLSLENRSESRPWSGSEIEALKTATRTLAAAIQRQEAERALAASEVNYRDLVETATDLVQSVDASGRLLFVNRAWREVLGYGAEEIADLTLWEVVAEESREVGAEALRQALSEGRAERVEAVFRTRDGDEISVEGSLARRSRGPAGPPEVLGIFRDVTERKMIDRLKQDFISTISHELRTPLTSLLGSLGLVQSPKLRREPGRMEELLAVAQRNGERLLRLINDLLDLQKMAAGELSFRQDPISVADLLAEAVDGIRGFAAAMGVELEPVRLRGLEEGEELWVLTDHDRLVQVLYNLLSNAIKFSAAGSRVALEAAVEGEDAVISVIDHGEGIPVEFRQRLFEKFTQADASNARRAGGSGLGLSIVRSLVDGLGGRIRVESEVGIGTRVTVSFPRLPPPPPAR